jgi:hypothetical protein
MHDLDRTQLETQYEEEAYGLGQEYEQYEGEGYLGEYGAGEAEAPLGELQELELASELLEVASEEELEEFLGKLIRSVGGVARTLARSPFGRQLTGILKTAAQQALPKIGGALGNLVAPGVGGALGSQLASQAGSMLGLELEGLSPQDQEFETARQFVRFASSAASQAAAAPGGAQPAQAVTRAVQQAAQQHAPGLLGMFGGRNGYGMPGYGGRPGYGQRRHRSSGRWVRRGHVVILYGV